MVKTLIIGANSQIGKELKEIVGNNLNFTFLNSTQLDLRKKDETLNYLKKKDYKVIVNLAAFTNVDKAEKNKKLCKLINFESIKNIYSLLAKKNIYFIQISSDFVFSDSNLHLDELANTNAINYYGHTKELLEKFIFSYPYSNYCIIRTSSVFSKHNNNFVKTIIHNLKINNSIELNNSILTKPTSAISLAKFIYFLIIKNRIYGVVHFVNKPYLSWYSFAKKIEKKFLNTKAINFRSNIKKGNSYKTLAKRPNNSILSFSKRVSHNYKNQENWEKYLDEDLKNLI